MGLELVQKQLLKLKMTPQLLQSVALLQFNNEQLADYIRQKALENPLIKARESDYLPRYSDGEARSTTEVIEETIADSADFRESLHVDLHQENAQSPIRDAADWLIDNLNDQGYLDGEPEQFLDRLNMSSDAARQALDLVQALEPAGIGARSLPECLLLQLKRLEPAHPIAERIISEFIDCFVTQDWSELAAMLDTDETMILGEVAVIRSLSPVPITARQSEKPQYIVPDITIRKTDQGLSCETEDAYLPIISLDLASYTDYMNEADKETKRYLREKKEEADWLLSGISRRKQTLAKVAELLMQEQQRYFTEGKSSLLRPFTMKQAAERLEIHESTVSRAVANKYIQTPYGLFPIKKFFVRPVQKENGSISAFAVQEKMKIWIESEDKRHPLSDQQLADRLANEGMSCSRRVVAKYRKLIGIGSTAERRLK
ncbi:RNA polymerase factor sigma-54 [Sporolactobacillus spathodeae]|uniref:RNA polymerase sigma-54 factor n=1 Tax=Sporolactobacillus spathodeae TaxID=1465502 RepID=A0ABS2Q645_9BACL|nr:RNA polymerase factor sigma-54 [Sporolactobacillus spathodeae]MBM7657193.1 RNA polymerase sigma-54 factor [Sporolactobacillus spathodeae]